MSELRLDAQAFQWREEPPTDEEIRDRMNVAWLFWADEFRDLPPVVLGLYVPYGASEKHRRTSLRFGVREPVAIADIPKGLWAPIRLVGSLR